VRRAGPSGDRDEAGERSSNSEKAVEERAAAAAGVAIDGGKGDPAECGRSPVSARAPAMVARSQTTAWALARRVTVAKSELARLRKASRMRTAVRRWLAVQLSPGGGRLNLATPRAGHVIQANPHTKIEVAVS